jgi:hypothetical protein
MTEPYRCEFVGDQILVGIIKDATGHKCTLKDYECCWNYMKREAVEKCVLWKQAKKQQEEPKQ